MLITTLVLGSCIGLILGLTGAGGGILAVPALTLVLGWSMTQAAPIALLAVASAAAIGVISAHKKGLVRYRAAMLISLSGMMLAPLGQHWAHLLPEKWLSGVFASVMLIVATRLWHSAATHTLSDDGITSEVDRVRKINVKTGHIDWNATSVVTLSAIGAITGLTTGLLGVGGGFIIVPALLRCSNITLNGIVATSLMVIALISSSAFLSAWITGDIALSESAGLFIAGTASGMLLGRHYADRIPKSLLLRFFSALIVTVSFTLLYKLI